MKSIRLIYMLALVICAIACKQKTNVEVQDEGKENQPVAEANKSPNVSGGHDNTFLTDQLFHYDAAFSIGKESTENPYAGHWIDLEPDGTYKSGIKKDQTHTGKWDYNEEMKVLLLRPDDNKFKISEWKVMHNNDMVVWVGTQTYGNNGTQIKLVRRTDLPQ